MRRLLWMLTFCMVLFSAHAQSAKVQVTGTVKDKETKEGIFQATVRLCAVADTTMVAGCVTEENGSFLLPSVPAGKYLLLLSYVGYIPQYHAVTFSPEKKTRALGTYMLAADVVTLSEALITAEAPKVVSKGDSLVFSASAYRVPDGSMLESLVKKLPGVQVDKDGNITVNGESVSKIMIDGHEFFANDLSMAMKNIPVEMVEKLKTYKKKSDLTRITGIDDGNEETVLDLSVKKDMSRGFFNNFDLAGGSSESYNIDANISRFKGEDKYTLIGSTQNVEGPWSFQNGTSKRDDLGFNFFKKTKKIELGGDAHYNGYRRDATTMGSSENFLSDRNYFSNNRNRNKSRNRNYNFSLRMEWKPDTMTNIIFRPSLSTSRNNNYSNGNSASFNRNPYRYTPNPLDDVEKGSIFSDSSRVNHSLSESKNEGKSLSGNMSLQIYRRLSQKGRSITFRSEGNYSDKSNDQFNLSTTRYYLLNNYAGADSLLYMNQYLSTPAKSYEINGQLNYVEPIFEKVYLQFSYKYTHRYNDSDRSTYDLTPYVALADIRPIGFLPDDYGLPVHSLSKKAEYDNDLHEGEISLRVNREKWMLSTGVRMIRTKTTMTYDQGFLDTTVTRHVTDYSPNLFFRYKFNDNTRLQVNYWGRTNQPSMTDMLPVRDETHPMWITEGNPNLRSSFNNSMRAYFNTFDTDKQRGINASLRFNNTFNSVSSKVFYNETTGGVVTRPENINGNWSTSGDFGINTALKDQRFTIQSFSGVNYQNQVAYISLMNSDSRKNITRTWRLWQSLKTEFRNDLLSVGVFGNFNCNSARNRLQPNNNIDTYEFSYGGEMEAELPLNFTLSSDIEQSSRRGYDDESFNTDELIWNARLGYKFLKENAASVAFEMFDILQQRSNIYRWVSATSRSDTKYVGVLNSYWMLHFIYKLNIFGV